VVESKPPETSTTALGADEAIKRYLDNIINKMYLLSSQPKSR
jgi:hypothetical protein